MHDCYPPAFPYTYHPTASIIRPKSPKPSTGPNMFTPIQPTHSNAYPNPHVHVQNHAQASSSRIPISSMPPHQASSSSAPPYFSSASASGSAFASTSTKGMGSGSTSTKRPKLGKKGHSSTTAKQRGVQASLEAKVDKCGWGWQAFFLPAKPMPNGPPCSPVLGPVPVELNHDMEGELEMELELEGSDLSRSTSNSSHCPQHQCVMGLPSGFGGGMESLKTQRMSMDFGGEKQRQVGLANGQGMEFGSGWKRGEQWVEHADVDME